MSVVRVDEHHVAAAERQLHRVADMTYSIQRERARCEPFDMSIATEGNAGASAAALGATAEREREFLWSIKFSIHDPRPLH